MSLSVLKEIKAAVSKLNPGDIAEDAQRILRVGLVASSDNAFASMEEYLAPRHVSYDKRAEVMGMLYRLDSLTKPNNFDLVLCEQGLACPKNAFTFYLQDPEKTIQDVLSDREDLRLPLARNFYPFRQPVVDQIVHRVSRDNALFALVTALPNIVPSFIELPWSVGEFASDTAFLTLNQVRMAFLIAAASDKIAGYSAQKGEIASIVTGAFGFRAIARELVGHIPLGGGLIPKGAVAYAGTFIVGVGLDRYNRLGYGLTRKERHENYEAAYQRGKGVVEMLLHGLKKRSAA